MKQVALSALAGSLLQNRQFLFFSDTGGYRWFVDTNTQRATKTAAPVDAGARK